MRYTDSLTGMFASAMKEYWELPALTEYGGETKSYAQIAHTVARLHEFFREVGIEPGDRVALIGRNSINWVCGFVATVTYGAVVVPILHEFKASTVHAIVEFSGAKMLLTSQLVWETLSVEEMSSVRVIMATDGWDVKAERMGRGIAGLVSAAQQRFRTRYPNGYRKEDVSYHEMVGDDLVEINYTSGTSGNPKGVMIPSRAMMSNMEFAEGVIPVKPGDRVLAVLPMAHAYGQAFDLLYAIGHGLHIFVLSKMPTPTVVIGAFKDVRPRYILLVPLVFEKIYKSRIKPYVRKPLVRFSLRVPLLRLKVAGEFRKAVTEAFGGEFIEVIIGGAALNPEVERFFTRIGFRFTVGYGMTECAPIISYAPWANRKKYSAGRVAPNMEMRINKTAPHSEVGEIEVRGANVMLGYYNRPEATAEVMSEDGWLRTGDLGEIDAAGNLTIRGRCKNMILGPTGQNIYPEEIEELLNNLPFVLESLVVQDGNRLVGVAVWDDASCKRSRLSAEDFEAMLKKALPRVNAELPAYSQLAELRMRQEEFEKTPKRSIMRYLYSLVGTR